MNKVYDEDTISVVIPFYSSKKWLEEAIESVLKQTMLPNEIIVVNDGSTEDISSIMTKYKKTVKFHYQENHGAASARNLGMKLSTGKYIAFLDSDDLWLPRKLEVQLNYMKKDNLYWSHSPYDVFDDSSRKIISRVNNIDTAGMMFPRMLARSKIGTPCVMLKKECLCDDRMVFNEKMRQGQDYCFWNILGKKYELGNTKEPLVLVRKHSNNKANDVIIQLKTRSMMYDFLLDNIDYFGRLPRLLNLAFCLCKISFNVSKKIQNKFIQKYVAYIFYITPWILFHMYYRYAKKTH